MKRPVTPGEQRYEQLLKRFWEAVYAADKRAQLQTSISETIDPAGAPAPPPLQFEREGKTWTALGFQRENPDTDFRCGGMLSLYCLVYFVERNDDDIIRAMVKTLGLGSVASVYPFAPVAINVTVMLGSLFWHRDDALKQTVLNDKQTHFWRLLQQSKDMPLAFFELFVCAMKIFDHNWRETKAGYMTSADVLKTTRSKISEVLSQNPRTIEELVHQGGKHQGEIQWAGGK
jgi:hypothetical protein